MEAEKHPSKLIIIDEKVEIVPEGNLVSLSKNGFANAILNEEPCFNHFNFDTFELIFAEIEKIINEHPDR